jgi:hypothetical protein
MSQDLPCEMSVKIMFSVQPSQGIDGDGPRKVPVSGVIISLE